MYAGSPYGGVWKSVDGGANWNNLNTDHQLPTIGVSAIVVDPQNGHNIFLGTGNHHDYPTGSGSIGIYRSQNGGLTWLPTTSTPTLVGTFHTIGNIIIHPANPAIAFAATSVGLYKSINANAPVCTWNRIPGMTGYFRTVIFKPGPSTEIYAAGTDIFRSVNGGVTWTSMTGTGTGLSFSTSDPVKSINLAVSPADPSRVYAVINTSSTLLVYSYNGTTWSQKVAPTGPQGDRDPVVVSPIDANVLFVGSVALYKSVTGGGQLVRRKSPAFRYA